jgi:hypothetical protein
MLTDSTDYLPEGLRLNVLLFDMDSIRFGKVLDLSDLDVILPACKPSEQVAKLAPNTESDVHALKGLIHTMESERKVCNMTPSFFMSLTCFGLDCILPSQLGRPRSRHVAGISVRAGNPLSYLQSAQGPTAKR